MSGSRTYYYIPRATKDYTEELKREMAGVKAQCNRERFFRLECDWHDLRKDISDLPDFDCGLKILCYFAYRGYGVWKKGNDEDLFKSSVLGWKYIEPFKL